MILPSKIGKTTAALFLAALSAVALERRTADGKTLLAVFNTNFDEMETIRLRAPYVPKMVEVLAPGGIWRRVEASVASGEMTLPIRLPCSHACVVRMPPQR